MDEVQANTTTTSSVEAPRVPAILRLLRRVHDRVVHRRRVQSLVRHFADLIPVDAQVIDIGCGDGGLDALIMQRRPDVRITGLEIARRRHTHIPVHLFDGVVLPFDDKSVDAVMFVDVLHHTLDPMVLMREAIRVARKAVVIKDHVNESVNDARVLRFMDWVSNRGLGMPLPYNYWSLGKWEAAWRELGLNVKECRRRLGLYPIWAQWLFEVGLHHLTLLVPTEAGKSGQIQG